MAIKKNRKPLIGFIGQGWIGKNYADNFEKRGFMVVRYALEAPYDKNKEKIKACDIVFIAVPTPTTPKGFDDDILRKVIPLVGKGNIAVVKSTTQPGTIERLQKSNPEIILMHSPEFLTEMMAFNDVKKPIHNIVGVAKNTKKYKNKARLVMSILPKAQSMLITTSRASELFKYIRNTFFYSKVVYMNLLYDIAQSLKVDWNQFIPLFLADPWIGNNHFRPVHKGGTRKKGRGIGGDCHIKDFAAILDVYKKLVKDKKGLAVFKALEAKNIDLLIKSKKDLNILGSVYGKKVLKKNN